MGDEISTKRISSRAASLKAKTKIKIEALSDDECESSEPDSNSDDDDYYMEETKPKPKISKVKNRQIKAEDGTKSASNTKSKTSQAKKRKIKAEELSADELNVKRRKQKINSQLSTDRQVQNDSNVHIKTEYPSDVKPMKRDDAVIGNSGQVARIKTESNIKTEKRVFGDSEYLLNKEKINSHSNATGQVQTGSNVHVKSEYPSDVKPTKRVATAIGNSGPVERIKIESNIKTERQLWEDHELLSETHNLGTHLAMNIINLFEEGNTIPFIARYRKDVTGNMIPEELRELKEEYEKILVLKTRARSIVKCLEKSGNLSPELEKCVLNARSMEEVEHIYAPYKPGGKRTLAERAKALGLEEPAMVLLNNTAPVDLYTYIDQQNTELDTFEKIEKGIVHIIAHIISTDVEVLTFMRKLRLEVNFTIEVKRNSRKTDAANKSKASSGKPVDESKFENYFNFKIPLKYIKPHQVLAINRGEAQKVLTVKIVVPDFMFNKFLYFCTGKFTHRGRLDTYRKKILDESIKDSYSRLMQPLTVREIRSELKKKAEKASYEVFSKNLKQLLLETPMKGRPILGIDPGFSNGCKIALVSSTGCLMDSAILFPHKSYFSQDTSILKNMLKKYNCNLIALGNGTACRETETWLVDLIKANIFSPLDVTYTIVSENGASIYSCSPEAKKEFPKLDPNLISAVSLARRVQDPLAELVKVEPKHLGVGMYQHDLPKKQLEAALDEVISECVSFVGVDLNTASQCLLRRIAGLSDKRATLIMEYKELNGPYRARKDLLSVKGIGPKLYKQCAGFLRVGPLTADDAVNFYKNSDANKLDCTIIHPESYEIALNIIKSFNLSVNQIGESSFIQSVKLNTQAVDCKKLGETFKTTEQTLKLILDTLCKPLDYDFRSASQQTPLFRKNLTTLTDLSNGTVLTGRVSNVTHFGCFVDIGVGSDGLIHISKMKGQNLQIGNRVEVTVINIEVDRKRIGLALNKVT